MALVLFSPSFARAEEQLERESRTSASSHQAHDGKKNEAKNSDHEKDDSQNEDQEVVVVDIRDVRELQREGRIPGSFHAPRGMIEFWIDPDSPYYKEIFGTGKRFVFHCASGWRSALVTQAVTQMGLTPVAHIGGGFKAWKEAGGPVTEYEKQATGRTPISASISS